MALTMADGKLQSVSLHCYQLGMSHTHVIFSQIPSCGARAWRLQWHPCRQRCPLRHWAWQQGISTSSCPEDMFLLLSGARAGEGGEQLLVAVEALRCANLMP